MWYLPGERTSVYLTAGPAAAVKASGTPLAELIRRGLVVRTAEACGSGSAAGHAVGL